MKQTEYEVNKMFYELGEVDKEKLNEFKKMIEKNFNTNTEIIVAQINKIK